MYIVGVQQALAVGNPCSQRAGYGLVWATSNHCSPLSLMKLNLIDKDDDDGEKVPLHPPRGQESMHRYSHCRHNEQKAKTNPYYYPLLE